MLYVALAIRAALRDGDVAYLKGDWTNRDPEITAFLERFGRAGVPLYVYFPVDGEPKVLPQVLTQALVVAALDPTSSATPEGA